MSIFNENGIIVFNESKKNDSNIEWKYVVPLKNKNAIDILESKYNQKLPKDLKECIKKNNSGSPNPKIFDMPDEKGKVFGGLLSFNKNDDDNIYIFEDLFKNSLFPFASTPFGDVLCVKNNKILLWCHETDNVRFISNTFTDLINSLY
jgi:hypothetical protein